MPITSEFTGVLDGLGYTINGLDFNYGGLFEQLNGKVKNLDNGLNESGYIADGLVFYADGYDAPINEKWIDRISECEGEISGVTYDETNKGYVWDTIYSSNAITFENSITMGEEYTVEVVINQPLITSAEPYPIILYFGSYPNNPRLYSSYENTGNDNWVAFYGYDVDLYKGRSQINYTPDEKHRICFSRNLSSNTTLDFGVDNSYKNITGFTSTNFGSQVGDNNIIIIGNADNLTNSIKGTIYCVRIYDRKLTEKELNFNYENDKERFNF